VEVVVISVSDRRQCEVGLPEARKNSGPLEHASLREDYLNQVQRDFLSRRRPLLRTTATPPAKAPLRALRKL
jgi:hypothetical protein